MVYMLNDEQLDWCKKVLAFRWIITCLGWGICQPEACKDSIRPHACTFDAQLMAKCTMSSHGKSSSFKTLPHVDADGAIQLQKEK